jgi:hypothetical protein
MWHLSQLVLVHIMVVSDGSDFPGLTSRHGALVHGAWRSGRVCNTGRLGKLLLLLLCSAGTSRSTTAPILTLRVNQNSRSMHKPGKLSQLAATPAAHQTGKWACPKQITTATATYYSTNITKALGASHDSHNSSPADHKLGPSVAQVSMWL